MSDRVMGRHPGSAQAIFEERKQRTGELSKFLAEKLPLIALFHSSLQHPHSLFLRQVDFNPSTLGGMGNSGS